MEVMFRFVNFRNMTRVPVSVFRSIEVQLKEKIRIEPTELGKKLNFIYISWMQNPKGGYIGIDPDTKGDTLIGSMP